MFQLLGDLEFTRMIVSDKTDHFPKCLVINSLHKRHNAWHKQTGTHVWCSRFLHKTAISWACRCRSRMCPSTVCLRPSVRCACRCRRSMTPSPRPALPCVYRYRRLRNVFGGPCQTRSEEMDAIETATQTEPRMPRGGVGTGWRRVGGQTRDTERQRGRAVSLDDSLPETRTSSRLQMQEPDAPEHSLHKTLGTCVSVRCVCHDQAVMVPGVCVYVCVPCAGVLNLAWGLWFWM